MKDAEIQLLIVDDSLVACQLLQFVAESDPRIKVIGTCLSGIEALEFLKTHSPDVILMDIHMPKMDGFETTRQIMSTKPIPIIICSADYTVKDSLKSFKAIEAGALAILVKPPAPLNSHFDESIKTFVDTIKTVAGIKLITRKSQNKSKSPPLKTIKDQPIDAIVIGASLGGPQALESIFAALNNDLKVPIFVAQHIATDFAEGLANWLKGATKFDFIVPKEGDTPEAGKVYIAPGRSAMEITKHGTITINREITDNQISSSITTLFKSVASFYGARAAGLILTGMGKDGVEGLLAMKKKGAVTIAQSEEDCLMFGMPKEAIQSGAATLALSLKEIPFYLDKLLDQ